MLAPAEEALASLCSAGIGHTRRLDRASGVCKEHAKAKGEVRYLLVGESLARIAADWEEYGAFPESLVKTLENILGCAIPVILQASSVEGAKLADKMKREIGMAILAWERTL